MSFSPEKKEEGELSMDMILFSNSVLWADKIHIYASDFSWVHGANKAHEI